MEVQINQQAFIWGNEEKYIDLPGYTKAQVHEDLPRRVQFTDVAQKTFKAGRKAGLLNLGLTRWAHKMRVLEEKRIITITITIIIIIFPYNYYYLLYFHSS